MEATNRFLKQRACEERSGVYALMFHDLSLYIYIYIALSFNKFLVLEAHQEKSPWPQQRGQEADLFGSALASGIQEWHTSDTILWLFHSFCYSFSWAMSECQIDFMNRCQLGKTGVHTLWRHPLESYESHPHCGVQSHASVYRVVSSSFWTMCHLVFSFLSRCGGMMWYVSCKMLWGLLV